MATPIDQLPSTNSIHRRKQEMDYLAHLNSRFATYMQRVHSVQEQTRSIENATLNAHTQALDAEIGEIRILYEQELANVRAQLDQAVVGRQCEELAHKKYKTVAADLESKLSSETNCRKKLETALGDAHRSVSEKEASYQEAQIANAEIKNAHVDTQTERNTLRADLLTMTGNHDAEAAKRREHGATIQQLEEKYTFAEAQYQQELAELNARLQAADQAIKAQEERLKEHDLIDEKLSTELQNVKKRAHEDFVRYTEDSEHSHQNSQASMRKQQEKLGQELDKSRRSEIKLKKEVEEVKALCKRIEAKSEAAEEKSRQLIHAMEMERNEAENNLESSAQKNRELEETVMNKERELTIERKANSAVDGELNAMAGLIEAGEQRMSVNHAVHPAAEMISKTSVRRPIVSNRPITNRPRPSVTTMFPPIAARQTSMVAPLVAGEPFVAPHHPYMGAHPGAYGPQHASYGAAPHPYGASMMY